MTCLTVNDIAFVMDSKVCTNAWEYCVSVYVVISKYAIIKAYIYIL